jgi:hypothetical protein
VESITDSSDRDLGCSGVRARFDYKKIFDLQNLEFIHRFSGSGFGGVGGMVVARSTIHPSIRQIRQTRLQQPQDGPSPTHAPNGVSLDNLSPTGVVPSVRAQCCPRGPSARFGGRLADVLLFVGPGLRGGCGTTWFGRFSCFRVAPHACFLCGVCMFVVYLCVLRACVLVVLRACSLAVLFLQCLRVFVAR